jgi:hypothetical protein
MFCARCGQQIPEALGLCPVCGQQVNATASPAPSSTQPVAVALAPTGIQPPPVPYAAHGPSGVGGWLLFFCISFTILWPLWQLSQYVLYHFAFRGPIWWLGPLRLVFGIVVGAVLWTGKPAAMPLLRIYYVFAGALTLWTLLNWLRLVMRADIHLGFPISFITITGSSIAFLISGVLYFATSERVRATYGSKLL